MMEKPPRPGLSLIKRAAITAVIVVLITAGGVSGAVFLQVDKLQKAFNDVPGGRQDIALPEITQAEAGKPQTIMILGTDERLGADAVRGEKPRSDTIILARMDAHKDAITLMSIPRDFKVTIPGFALPDKINAAFSNGGANLTLKTVKHLLSRPGRPFKINHVVQVSFTGFRRMVDYLGCTYVDIDRDYFNDVGGPGGYATIDINPGYQKLCGKDALDYVRYRHTDNDLVRGARQQDFIRQMLRQRGVRTRLNFGAREQLAHIAGRYTRTDKSLRKTAQLFSLLKLGLAVANKPIQEVPFGAGQIRDDGSYLTASDAAIGQTVDDFMNARSVNRPRVKLTESTAEKKFARKSRTRHKASDVSGLEVAETEGQNQAIVASRRLDFPFYFPKLRVTGSRYVGTVPRTYTIRDELGHKHRAYRMVVSLGIAGEYYGIQGMTWKKPPILDGPHDTVRMNGRKLLVYYDGRRVRLVAWRTSHAVYYVHNTLARTVSRKRLVAIAGSLEHLGH
ncbi:MAG: polyisoprenyl-teichoic acid--peptidoglycan teichoic acid transferase [Solirubrobacteraceae bacterium]|jgi:LCP family protein required for cell wall assembly|nr:polyisoprenyl-teichoic acid--peptidoglycan teichoic acid transferase [Solirubrobacteraceae bacterium]